MKTTKLMSMFLALGLLVSISATSFAQKANFAGSYTYNAAKSNAGENNFRQPASKITVTQDAAALSAERTGKGFDGQDQVTKEKYNLDGTVSENPVFGTTMRKSKVVWSTDGKTITISSSMTFDMNGQSTEIKSSEAWTLGADGSITIVAVSSSPMGGGETKQTLVYDKAK